MFNQWVHDQFKGVNCGDFRLDQRALSIAQNLSRFDGPRLTAQFKSKKELKEAYRFMSNEKTSFDKVASSHWHETAFNCKGKKQILAVQDTTVLSYLNLLKTEGMMYINKEKPQGLLLHSVMALDGNTRSPIGMLHGQYVDRDIKDFGKEDKNSRRQTKFEDKESYRWLESVQKVQQLFEEELKLEEKPEIVFVGDRESDIFEVLKYCKETEGLGCVIRCSHNRNIQAEYKNVFEACEYFPVAGQTMITVEDKKTHKYMKVKVDISFGKVKLKIPSDRRYGGSSSKLQKSNDLPAMAF